MNIQEHLETLKRMQARFEDFRKHIKTDQEKTGASKSFEFCYELSWKLMKRVLADQGIDALSPKEVFRKAATAGFISDPEVWFEFQKKRNIAAHDYDEIKIDDVIADFDSFSIELYKLITKIEEFIRD